MPESPPSVLLFDLDGTLIDSKRDLASSINLMLRDLDRPPLSEETVAGFVGDGVRVLVRRSLTATHPEQQPPDESLHMKGVAVMLDHYAREMLRTTTLYPGVAETLRAFERAGRRAGLVTSKETRFARSLLEHFDIAQFFDCLVGGDTTPARKPDPAPVVEALRQLGARPSEAVMIGDSENDIYAGRAAGTRTCGVSFGFRTAEQLRRVAPDDLVDRFEDLREIFG